MQTSSRISGLSPTCATGKVPMVWAFNERTPAKVVSDRLDHKDIATMLNAYPAAPSDIQVVETDALERIEQRATMAS
jgi:hypothetical protein